MSMDLSKLSDDDLDALSKGDMSKVSDEGLEHISEATKPPSALSKIASGLGDAAKYVGDKYESYVTGPTRAAIMEEAKNGLSGKPLSAFISQFGGDPGTAPSGKDIAKEIGFSTVPSPNGDVIGYGSAKGGVPMQENPFSAADIAGGAINFAADPLLVAPVGKIIGAGRDIVQGTASLGYDAMKGIAKGVAGTADALTGTEAASKAMNSAGQFVDSVGNVGSAANEALRKVFSPQTAQDFPALAATAQKHGIDVNLLPESVEFGQGSFLDTAARARREGPLGEEYLAKFKEGHQQVQQALDKSVARISGSSSPISQPEAGLILRKGFDQGIKNFWDTIDMSHNDIVTKWAPGLHVDAEEMGKLNSVVNGIEKYAKGQAERGITATKRSQAEELLNAVTAFRAGNGSYKQTLEAMRDIGDAAFSTSSHASKIPSDTEKLQKLYFAIDDALINTVDKHVSPEFAAELRANNGAMSDMFKKRDQVGHILSDKDVAPENAFKRIILNGDTDQIATLQKMLPPEDMQKIKGAFVESLIKRDLDGSYNMSGLYNAMRSKQNQMKMLFSPDEIAEMGDLMRLGDRFGKVTLSSSGTGASNVFHHLLDSLKSGVSNDTMIESLKNKARNPVPALPPSGGGASRSPVWYGAKAVQTVLPSDPISRRISSDKR